MTRVFNAADVSAATLDIASICERYRVTRRTIYRWISTLDFPAPVQVNRRKVRWIPTELDAWDIDHPNVALVGSVSV